MAKKDQSKEEVDSSAASRRVASEEMLDTKREVTKSSDFVAIYANDIQVQTSPWDLRLSLGELGDMTLNANGYVLNVRQLAEVRLSPQIAKQLVNLLVSQLQTYELQFGKIPQPVLQSDRDAKSRLQQPKP
jgi:hypothetical protein